MQRLARKDRNTPSNSATAVADAPEEGDTDMTNLPAINQGYLATVGGYEKHEAITYQDDNAGAAFKFLRFFSGKSNNAVDVKIALGKGIVEGHPYISTKGEITDASRDRFAVLEVFPHWVTTGQDHAPDRCWLEPQPFGRKIGQGESAQKVKEAMVALVLFFPHDGAAYTALAEVKTTKVPFIKDYLKAVDKACTPEGAAELGKIAGQVPPKFRVLGSLRMVPKTGSGFSYALAKADCEVVTVRELEALQEWASDEDAQAEIEANKSLYDRKVKEMTDLANNTKD